MTTSNVSARGGSKATSRATGHGRGGMKVAPQHDGSKPGFSDGGKTSADGSGQVRHADYNAGGHGNRDVPEQNADQQKGGVVGHTTATKGAGTQFANEKNRNAMEGWAGSQPAAPARTGKRNSDGKIDVPTGDNGSGRYRDDTSRADVGTNKIGSNEPSSVGSSTRYDKSDSKPSGDKMPSWSRSADRHESRRGG